jgi:hypothetical protein
MTKILDETIIERLKSLSLLEAAELVKDIEQKQIDSIFDELFDDLSNANERILDNQVSIDNLKLETREMLTILKTILD